MKSQTVSNPMSSGQKNDIIATFTGLIPDMTTEDAQMLIGNKGVWAQHIRRSFEPFIKNPSVRYWLEEMARFYSEVFGLECDFSQLQMPISREGFGWLVVVDERVTAQAVYEQCQRQFICYKYIEGSLDKAVPTNDRDQKNGTYAIWLRDTVEADDVHRNKSANDLKAANVSGITLRERLILELWHFWKTGKHLDIQNITLCSGSRYDDGFVPDVRWFSRDSKLSVNWCYAGSRGDRVRVREVVS